MTEPGLTICDTAFVCENRYDFMPLCIAIAKESDTGNIDVMEFKTDHPHGRGTNYTRQLRTDIEVHNPPRPSDYE